MIEGLLNIDYSNYITKEFEIYNIVREKALSGIIKCPECCNQVSMHGTYKRKIITGEADVQTIIIVQVKCEKCGKVHSVLPGFVSPNKLYLNKLIKEALNSVTYATSFADDSTIRRWRKHFRIDS